MVELPEGENWLLVDAAGPVMAVGIVRDGHWLACETMQGEALESIEAGTRRLLDRVSIKLSDLDGCLYAEGPGSTLGLRLAAMFLRGLMKLPGQGHWKCRCYNNLQLACAAVAGKEATGIFSLAAPWRKDRLHTVTMETGDPPSFRLGSSSADHVFGHSLQIINLGRRPPRTPGDDTALLPYPVDRIPAILHDFPMLMKTCRQPSLYVAEVPAFAKWSPKRHGTK